ncbi:outer membrane beta-barrel family protein [Zhouia spongiae]|uniref:Outer membrane beta-barrel family protein n=1 Tax=Zhouia spongiae TaxID=2202721 RepID=A0ABY3YQU5_9FLAO|nr:outer membrane beta-barrel protein [Zhouia spongiae]UNZ00206.1 outer membrane beta-barrel family protein [Zhouia spongiae]
MRKKITLIILLLGGFIYAQDFVVKGIIKDGGTNTVLEAATIYAETLKDSTLISYTISEKDGSFELELQTPVTKANLYISYSGYGVNKRIIELNKSKIELGEVLLEQHMEELEGVSVVGERIPIQIKKDTLEFNADSFKARPDANVEELLKKLPGVEVDSDGKITVNGRDVNRVLVNGKAFFGDDPKIATKNLPKEIIDKIQITDTKSETEEFTGKESNSEEKTINITIKEDKNKGHFGRMTAGYGTDDRYQLNGMLNMFKGEERVSILAGKNNINSAGFSMDEIFDMVGNSGRRSVSVGGNGGFSVNGLSFGFGQGITTSTSIGGNYANEFNDKTELTADYFYGGSSSFNDTKTSRENILPDRRYFTESTSSFDGDTDSHRANARFEFELDSTLKITLAPRFNLAKSLSSNVRSEMATDENGDLINESESANVSENEQQGFSNNLSIIKRFGSNGRFLRVGFNNNNNVSEGISNLNTLREVYGNNPSEEEVDQQTSTNNRSDAYGAQVEFRQPIVENLFADIEYNYDWQLQKNHRIVNDYDDVTGGYTDFNQDLSSDFIFKNIRQRSSFGLNYEGESLSVGVNANWQNTQMNNDDYLQNTQFDKDFNNFYFTSRVRWRLSRNKRIRFDYRSNVDVPSISQLQPIENISNPTNIITGNPDLDASLSHRISFNYNNFDWRSRSGMFIYGSMNFQNDRITRLTVTDENFIRRTTYTNVDGNYSANLGASYGKQIKKDTVYTLGWRLRLNGGYNNEISFSNGVKFTSKNFSFTPRLTFDFNYKELIDIEPGYAIAFNNTSYTLDNLNEVKFITHNAELRTSTYWPKNIIWGNDIVYSYNGNVSDGFDKSSVFWNMSLGVQMFKEKGTLKLLAYDLLDQNINTRRTVAEDYIQDSQSTVLQRYFMLSFTWKFDKFGGKRPPSHGGMRFRRF